MEQVTLELDAAHTDEALQALVAAFSELQPGEALVLATPGDPRKLTRRFSDTAWGQFDWAPLHTGDDGWRTQVRKRTGPLPQSISEFLTEDHKRCDELYAQAEAAALAGDADQAAEAFGCFEAGMLRHFTMEEEGLFPRLDQRMGFHGQGPTAVMREEHGQVRRVLARMCERLEGGDLQGFTDGCDTLLVLMEQHNMKEEEVLYPMMDQVLTDDLDALFKQLITF